KRIVGRHAPVADIDDISQIAFIQIYRSIGRFRGESTFKTWMTRIVLRQCYSVWARKEQRAEVLLSELSSDSRQWLDRTLAGAESAPTSDPTEQSHARKVLSAALAPLSDEERMIVMMVFLEGYSAAEVAEVLGWTAVRVRVKIHRVRKRLQAIIESI